MKNTYKRAFFNWKYVPKERRTHNKVWAIILVLSIPTFVVVQRYVLSAGRVGDVSMLPTLTPGRYFLINKYIYLLTSPRRGDVVVVRPPTHRNWYYVKRIIGVEGDLFSVSGGRVIINGEPLDEPYTLGTTEPEMRTRRIPPNSYVVMGDNRPNSEDTRQFGFITRDRIEGKIRPKRLFSFW